MVLVLTTAVVLQKEDEFEKSKNLGFLVLGTWPSFDVRKALDEGTKLVRATIFRMALAGADSMTSCSTFRPSLYRIVTG